MLYGTPLRYALVASLGLAGAAASAQAGMLSPAGMLGPENAGAIDRPTGEATGDWFGTGDEVGSYRLTMRATSYTLVGRSGQSMSGEYVHAGHEVVVANGPLKGFGASHGTLATQMDGRTLQFEAGDRSILRCREVL